MLEINNLTRFSIDKKSFSQVAKKVLKGENRETDALSLAFVNKPEIERLNKKFRKNNKATDVLSFSLDEKGYLGEIVICPVVVKENAKKYNLVFKKELLKVFVHGILHLLGYDHEKNKKEAEKMEQREKNYFKIKN